MKTPQEWSNRIYKECFSPVSGHASVSPEFIAEIQADARKELAEALEIHTGKKAPVQGYAPGIPWDMHMEAYAAYCKKYGKQDALIEGWCRGGFGTEELDAFIPGWRDELKRRHESSRATSAAIKEENAGSDAPGAVEKP